MNKKDWNNEAKTVLKAILADRNIKYQELANALNRIGIEENYNSISTKLNRGTFSFAFFLQCLHALEIRCDEIEV